MTQASPEHKSTFTRQLSQHSHQWLLMFHFSLCFTSVKIWDGLHLQTWISIDSTGPVRGPLCGVLAISFYKLCLWPRLDLTCTENRGGGAFRGGGSCNSRVTDTCFLKQRPVWWTGLPRAAGQHQLEWLQRDWLAPLGVGMWLSAAGRSAHSANIVRREEMATLTWWKRMNTKKCTSVSALTYPTWNICFYWNWIGLFLWQLN